MPDVVEIYICKADQKLEEGKMVVSNDIGSKEDAKADAERRCANSTTIARIAYYAISPSGDFKSFFSYKNPNAGATKNKKPGLARDRKPATKKKAIKLTTWQKLKITLGFK